MLSPVQIHPIDSKLFSDVTIFLLQNTETDLQTQRLNLRRHLVDGLKQFKHSTKPELLDLLKVPMHSDLSLSLSHTKAYSCFSWCPKPSAIGVDIEDLLRLKTSLITRVSSPSEMSTAPRWELLWSCKEAVFKAIPAVNVLSSVEIFDFVPLQNDVWRFRARETKTQTVLHGYGEVRLILGHTLAFFKFTT
jgi:phosphopantetheinyl transferase (holo-ACP synthase)